MRAIKKVRGNKLSALVDRMSMNPGSMNQPSKHLRFPKYQIVLGSSPQMQPTMPGRFASTTGNGESRATSRSTGDRGNIRNEEDHSGLIQNSTRSAMPSERFFSWIEAFKKIAPRYEHSFMGLIHLACSVMIGRILG